MRESVQAMTKRVDKVEHQSDFVRSGQEEEVERAVEHATFRLKTAILHEVDKEIELLETRSVVKMSEAHQSTTIHLQEIKD